MSLPPPREGSRDTREGLIISKFPDVCRSPQCPVPYTIVAYQSDDANTAASVRMTGQRAHKQNSIVTRCTGDEPGTGLGVKSNTVSSVCHRKEHSSTVRIEGQWATRHGDAWYMNNRNTIGKLNWYTGNKNFDPTPPLVAAAEMSAGSKVVMSDVSSSSPPLRPGTQLAFVDTSGQSIQPQTRTVPRSQPSLPSDEGGGRWRVPPPAPKPEAPLPPALRWLGRASWVLRLLELEGSTPRNQRYLGPRPQGAELGDIYDEADGLLTSDHNYNIQVAEWYRREILLRRQEQSRVADHLPESGRSDGNTSIEEDERRKRCRVAPYKVLRGTCEEGEQAHHIVPDYTLRYGTRPEGALGEKRIGDRGGKTLSRFMVPFPSFLEGPAICLKGNAKDDGSEHWEAHGADKVIAAKEAKPGNINPVGTARIGDIKAAAIDSTVKARRDCEPEIRAAVAAAFPGVYDNRLGRTTESLPTGEALDWLVEGTSITRH